MPFIDLFIFTPVICEDWRRQLFARGKKKKTSDMFISKFTKILEFKDLGVLWADLVENLGFRMFHSLIGLTV